ncbi:TonB-dependent receptor [Pedobacter rhizosphaerae]|uniref:Outer membrane receptor proteins, mostly Fe transport n=1 Tax=Pedobacter rhizosphaerae TaxID=390241 RepID=A0A1H9TPC8_9SPHI|nr:TonB-dependent receptor [Pedobacter rhizosphaerae]SER98971.1 Outer membrane receptor proteins, mostly Fe transport [Pedobacter rhizosphaerae]
MKTYLLIILCILSTKTFAQLPHVTGKVLERKNGLPLEYAGVILSSKKDSTKRVGLVTNKAGEFIFKDVANGDYQIKISVLGYLSLSKNISVSGKALSLGTFKLEEDAINLKDVAVKARYATATVKKDTIEFNADAYKTKPNAAVEDLIKKLPGVTVDKDGSILVGGQKVTRLTVDGKDFFGTDPKTATKNLPADAIAKVQLIDSKTLEAKATGIDDGQREKVLNLTIKEDKKKGWFGNASLSGGTTDKYGSYLSANHFNKNLQFAVLGMSNNTNDASFGYDDLNSFSSGNIGNIFAPPAGGSFSINVNNGKTTVGGSGVFDNNAIGLYTTHSGGVNYSNSWGKNNKLSLSGSYFTYFSSGLGNKLSNIQDLSSGDILRTLDNTDRNSDNQAHRFNFKAEYHPDSLTDITFRPNVILNNTTNINNRSFNSFFDGTGKTNDGSQYYNQHNFSPSLFGEFSVLRRMANKKGSISLRLNGTQNTYNSDWLNRSLLNQYTNGTPTATNINQEANQENASKTYTLNASYARPLSAKWSSNLGYTYNRSLVNAAQATFDYNATTGSYDVIVPNLTNTFDSQNYLSAAGLGFIFTGKDWTYNFGVNLQQTGLNANTFDTGGANINQMEKTYYNLLPRLMINFKNKANQTLAINYRASVNLPAVTDLQPVQNNTNPLYQREGNPDLEARKNHRISVNFNTFSPDNNRYWNGYFLYNLAFDDTGNNIRYDKGVQYVRPVNVGGNYFLRAGTFFGMPAKLKGLRTNYGVNFFAEHRTSFISDEKNITNRFEVGPNINWSYDVDDKFNADVYAYVAYTKVNNSLETAVDNRYFTLSNSLNISYEFIKDLRIEADLDHIGSAGRADGFNSNYFLLNAGINKYIMQRQVTLSLKGFDILNQNTSIDRIINSSRIEDVRYNNITRYFYLSLNYKLSKVGAKNERSNPRNTVN